MTPATCELSDGPVYEGRQPLSKAMMPLRLPAGMRRAANESVPEPLRFAAAQPPEPGKTVYDPVPFTESAVHVRVTTTPIPDVEYPEDHGPSRGLGAGGDVSPDPHAASSAAEMRRDKQRFIDDSGLAMVPQIELAVSLAGDPRGWPRMTSDIRGHCS